MTKKRKGLTIKFNNGIKELKYHTNNQSDYENLGNNPDNSYLPKMDSVLTYIRINNVELKNLYGITLKELKEIIKNISDPLMRKSTYTVEETFEILGEDIFNPEDRYKKEFDGDMIKANSQRYQLFKTKSCTCVRCGITGTFFAKEKRINDKSYHLNLYGYDKNGNEVLMTKDHILPKSKGGEDILDNYQPMCEKCNTEKGNNLESEVL